MAVESIEKASASYLLKHAADVKWRLEHGDLGGIRQAVIIPVRAEKEYLFGTLFALASNARHDLDQTLVVCVVNNREIDWNDRELISDNQMTLAYLRAMVAGFVPDFSAGNEVTIEYISGILRNGLRIACVDASSSGLTLSDRDGVGMARKIGMDRTLEIMAHQDRLSPDTLICLDADTLVEDNYLSSIGQFYLNHNNPAAVVSFAHQDSRDGDILEAITRYEIFLRYYTIGLRYAGSPYAFYSIGSTITCKASSYVAVHGMSLKQAGEDFYFLNKLAKNGPMGHITSTTVHPSSRPSSRVPFGTGPAVQRFLSQRPDKSTVYHPEIFDMLKKVLECIKRNPVQCPAEILKELRQIHPAVVDFFNSQRFSASWEHIRSNSGNPAVLRRHFHIWFDGFRTLKLVHYLSDNVLPKQELFSSLKILLNKSNAPFKELDFANPRMMLADQIAILEHLRELEIS
jgi:hypothetical protein